MTPTPPAPPNAASNPFYVGGPVPAAYFVGRSQAIRIAFDQISKRGHAAFYGSPGMGKSSLLNLLVTPTIWQTRGLDISQFYIVSLNCTDVTPFTPSGFFRAILDALRDQVEDQLDECQRTGVADYHTIEATGAAIAAALQADAVGKGDLRRVVGRIGKSGKSLLLLLDDFDWALRPHDQYTEAEMLTFLNEFRNLAVHSAEREYLTTLITSFRPITVLGPDAIPSGSPWYNHYLCLSLPPFSVAEVHQYFFQQPDSPLFIPISAELKTAVLQMTGGHPCLLQNALYLLFDHLQTGTTPDPQAFAQAFISRTEHFFRDTWRFATNEEQVMLMLVALSQLEGRLNRKIQYSLKDLDLVFSQRSRELFDLEELGIIKRNHDGLKSSYTFTSAMMEWWVLREIESSNVADLERREKVFFNWMSREQAERIKTVVNQIWQQKDAIKGAVEWIVGLFKNPIAN